MSSYNPPISQVLASNSCRLCIYRRAQKSISSATMAAWLAFWFLFSGFSASLLFADSFQRPDITRVKSAAYDELYADARYAYSGEKWNEAIELFEKAIADYKQEKDVKIHCRSHCRDRYRTSASHNLISDLEMDYYRYTIYSHKCSQQCREKYLGKRTKVSAAVKKDFESRMTYGYLQFAYYKVGELSARIKPFCIWVLSRMQKYNCIFVNIIFFIHKATKF